MTIITRAATGTFTCWLFLVAPNDGWSQYLTGADRSQFVAGTINGCIRPKNTDSYTAAIPVKLFEEYCRCYANGLADRISMQDIKTDNRAVTDPIVRDVAKKCYDAMKSDALKDRGQ